MLLEQLQAPLGAAYTIERELRGGGMSKVFLATENRLKRKVVVKVLSPDLAQGVSADRFEREIQLAAQRQANIVPLLATATRMDFPTSRCPSWKASHSAQDWRQKPLPRSECVSILRDQVPRDFPSSRVLGFERQKAPLSVRSDVPRVRRTGISLGCPSRRSAELDNE
jgi:hypothetical protein